MESLGLLVGHLAGDYLVQNDWMARNKTSSHLACLCHCLAYTFMVWACSSYWMPWWGVVVCFVAHYPFDRWRWAAYLMTHWSGQAHFASPAHPMYPWSVVVVDNTYHLVTLWVIGRCAGL